MATKTTPRLPLNGEELITLAEAASHYPSGKGKGRLHPATLTRRILKGQRSVATGRVVKLEAIREGSRWLTSWEAIERFHNAIGPPADDDARPQAESTSDRGEEAGKVLERMGA